MDKTTAHQQVAALAFEIVLEGQGEKRTAPARMRVIPDGHFDAVDGRPGNMEGVEAKTWFLDAAAAAMVDTAFKAGGVKLPIDYEHQTLNAQKNGQPAPAAAWITGLEYSPGAGMLAHVTWTAAGRTFVEGEEYLYISPILIFNAKTGVVVGLHSVALTNKPALGALGAITALTNDSLRRLPGSGRTTNEEPIMEKTKVLVALGLPLDTGDDTALAQLSALVQKSKELETQVATLKANQFDPAKHIPLEEHTKLTTELATLKATGDKAEHERLMTTALADARILPPNEAYWRAQPLAALQAFLKDAKPLAALKGMQTDGKPPVGNGGELDIKDADAIAQAALKFQKAQADAGITITTAQAVEHVTTKKGA